MAGAMPLISLTEMLFKRQTLAVRAFVAVADRDGGGFKRKRLFSDMFRDHGEPHVVETGGRLNQAEKYKNVEKKFILYKNVFCFCCQVVEGKSMPWTARMFRTLPNGTRGRQRHFKGLIFFHE
jgi:hypothetical protein